MVGTASLDLDLGGFEPAGFGSGCGTNTGVGVLDLPLDGGRDGGGCELDLAGEKGSLIADVRALDLELALSLIHISEPTRPY